ncbi:hypothetical protein [Ferrovum sp.]|uniref:hypothetical protein n=1 Tax=Ferrovum sp. TaxID=2609467 RepID=UPI00262012C1|nr:hypothetical protein [Ferrovum sp.]
MTTEKFFLWPQPDLTRFAKPGKSVEVQYPVSYRYNGGTLIDDEWYAGYEVPPPIVPPGFKLVGIGVGFEFNHRPPLKTMILKPI